MKTIIFTSILALTVTMSSMLKAQVNPDEYLGLPGDNLNLFAVMNLFQESETLENFEKNLNDPEKMINNLDLNNDNFVDYIMVFDYHEGDIHNIVLRVALNQKENQDVAVFIVEKFADNSVRIQLIGDEALYGPNYIVEPNYAETPNPGYRGKTQQYTTEVVTTTYYEVAYWPMIEFIYEPFYVVWASPWYWGCYVPYWHPWRPHFWHFYYGYHWNWFAYYYTYYRPWRYHRCSCYHHGYYASIRNYSPTIIININNGVYTNTYSKPEKKLEGEKLFAEKNPNGVKDFSRREKNKSADERPEKDLKTKDSGNTARTDNDDSKSYNIIKTRPMKETEEKKGTNDNFKRENNVSRERPAEPVRTTTKEKQSTENKPEREVKSTNTERKQYNEPVRETRNSSSGYDNSRRESKPSTTREDRSSSSSGSSSRSSESKSNKSSSSSSRSEYKSSGSSSSSSSGRSSSSSSGSSSSGSSSSKSNDSKSNSSSSKKR